MSNTGKLVVFQAFRVPEGYYHEGAYGKAW